jgi:hypothetical protein
LITHDRPPMPTHITIAHRCPLIDHSLEVRNPIPSSFHLSNSVLKTTQLLPALLYWLPIGRRSSPTDAHWNVNVPSQRSARLSLNVAHIQCSASGAAWLSLGLLQRCHHRSSSLTSSHLLNLVHVQRCLALTWIAPVLSSSHINAHSNIKPGSRLDIPTVAHWNLKSKHFSWGMLSYTSLLSSI